MASCLTQEQYQDLQAKIARGQARVVVTRSLARQFFFNVANRNVRDLTGQSMRWPKFVVVALLIISVMMALTCFGLVISNFGWWATLGVPLVGIFWTVLAGFTTEMGSVSSTSAMVAAALMLSPMLPGDYSEPFVLFAGSLFSYRLAHFLAEYFFVGLIKRSFDAYDMLCEQIDIEHDPV